MKEKILKMQMEMAINKKNKHLYNQLMKKYQAMKLDNNDNTSNIKDI